MPPKRKLKVNHTVPVPVFDPENMEYEIWKKKLLRWNKLSSLPEAEKALTFHLSLTGRAEIASANIPDEELEKEGVKKIQSLCRTYGKGNSTISLSYIDYTGKRGLLCMISFVTLTISTINFSK